MRHGYAGLDACWAHYEEALKHWDIGKVNDPMTPERKAALERYGEHAGRYFELKFSEAMFAGSILQAAYMAIKLYSRNKSIPPSCTKLVRSQEPPHAAAQFCIGREYHGIPAGLIIYAGRNQFNHWDDDLTNKVTIGVFNALSDAFMDNPWADLAFSLSNWTINIYANEILLTALGWRSYDVYFREMTTMLHEA